MSPVLDERHDLAHPVEGDEAWSESYYFNAYDPDADVGFFTRIGVRPNEGTMDVGFSVWIPGGGLATVRGIRQQHEMTDTELEVGGVRYERVAPCASGGCSSTPTPTTAPWARRSPSAR